MLCNSIHLGQKTPLKLPRCVKYPAFGYAANCFYNNGTPSNGAIAMISGDFGYGLEQEWKSAATSVEYLVNLAGILISPFSSQKEEMNKLIEQSKR